MTTGNHRIIIVAVIITALLGFQASFAAEEEEEKVPIIKEEVLRAQSNILGNYIVTSGSLTEAEVMMAEALGLKDVAGDLEAVASFWKNAEEPSKKEIKKIYKESKKARKMFESRLEEGDELSDEAKGKFIESMGAYAVAIPEIYNLVAVATEGASSAATYISENPLEILSAKKDFGVIIYLGTRIPSDAKVFGGLFKNYLTFAKRNKIDLPKENEMVFGEDPV